MSMAPSHLEISEQAENRWVRVALAGELDLASAPQLRDRLSKLAANHSAVRLDLARLEFIDSSGLQVLVGAIKAAQGNGWRLQIDRETTSQVRRLLELVHLDDLIRGYGADGPADLSQLRVRL